jgi:integrase
MMPRKPRSHTYGTGRIFQKTRHGRPYGHWIVEYYVHGAQRRENSMSTREQDAVQLLKQRVAETQAGLAPAARAASTTVRHLLDDLRARYELERRPSLRNCPSYEAAWAAVLDLDRPAATLQTAQLDAAAVRWCRTGVKPASVNNRMIHLRRAYSLARRCTPPKVRMIPTFPPRLEPDNVREGWFTDAQIHTILTYLEAHDPVVRDFVEWFFWTAMRPGAIAALTWASVDRKARALRLVRNPRRTKGKPKWLPLEGHLGAIIDRAWARTRVAERARGTVNAIPWVFWRTYDGQPRPGLRPGDPTPIVDYRKVWTSACRAAGCPGMVPYDLRRTALRNLIRAGVDEQTAMELSGHKRRTTFERYNIIESAELAQALAQTFAAHRAAVGTSVGGAASLVLGADVGRMFSRDDPDQCEAKAKKPRK